MKKSIFAFTALLLNLVIFSSGCSFISFQPPPEKQSRTAEESCRSCDNAIPQTNAEIRAWYNRQVVISEFPYVAVGEHGRVKIRINDFPAEPLYSLIADDVVLCDFDQWPPNWQRGEA